MKQRVVWREVDHSKHDGKFPELKDSIHDPIMPRDRMALYGHDITYFLVVKCSIGQLLTEMEQKTEGDLESVKL